MSTNASSEPRSSNHFDTRFPPAAPPFAEGFPVVAIVPPDGGNAPRTAEESAGAATALVSGAASVVAIAPGGAVVVVGPSSWPMLLRISSIEGSMPPVIGCGPGGISIVIGIDAGGRQIWSLHDWKRSVP